MRVLISLVLLTSLACGRSSESHRGMPPQPEGPASIALSFQVEEPNPLCPGRFAAAAASFDDFSVVTDLARVLASLPEGVKRVACRVDRIETFTGGLTGYAGKGTIGLNETFLSHRPKVSEWMRWRTLNLTAPGPRARYDTSGAIETVVAEPDDFDAALTHVLTHELGHVAWFQPEWKDGVRDVCGGDTCEFNSWEEHGALKPEEFPDREAFCLYGPCERPYEPGELARAYSALRASTFISFYSVTNVAEEIAENYASAVLIDVEGFRMRHEIDGQLVFDRDEHWLGPSMAAKRDAFRKLIDLPMPVSQ